MNFENSIKNIARKIILSNEEKYNIINEYYNNYIKTKDKMYLERYIQILLENKFQNYKELFLKEIEENKTILDYIIEKNITINYDVSYLLANDVDLLKVFLNHKVTSILSYTSEETFNKIIDNITLIEYLVKNELLDSRWTKKIEPTLMINTLFKYNKVEYLIQNNYLTKDTIAKINNPLIYEVLVKYDREDLLKYLSNTVLTFEYNGIPILEHLFEKNIIPQTGTLYDEKIVKIILKNKKLNLLENISEYLLRKKIPGTTTTLFEYLTIKGIVCKEAIETIRYDLTGFELFLDIITKYNKFELLETLSEDELLKNTYNNETLFEVLIKKGITPKNIMKYSRRESIDILIKYNKYDELQKCNPVLLHLKLPNGKKLYEEILDKGFDIKLSYLEDIEIIKYLIANNKTYVYSMLTVNMQLKKIDENKTLLESIFENEKENDNIDLSQLKTFTYDFYKKAQLYILYAKYDKQNYLKKITKEDLFERQTDTKNFLDILLELDEELTLNKILSDEVKEDYEVAMLIKLHGLKQKNIKFDSLTIKLEREYLTNLRFEYEALTLDNVNEELLGELYTIMNDTKSAPYLIYSLIASYRNLLSKNSEYSYEVKNLINIKKENPSFIYKYVNNGTLFNPTGNYIGMEDANIDTLNHETGHALLNYLTNKEVPYEFAELIEKISKSEQMLEKAQLFSSELEQIKKDVEEEVEKYYMSKYDESITEEKKKEIQEFLDEEIILKKQKYVKLGYDEELLNKIFDELYTLDEYIEQDRRIKKKQMVELILRTRYASYLCTSDYIDAIYKGKYKGKELKDKNGIPIIGHYGHGIEYYSKGVYRVFSEMIANYSEIIKSKNPELGIEILRNNVGDELVDFMKDYYEKNILHSKKYEKNTTLTKK